MKTSVCHQPASQAGTQRVEFEFESRPLHCISHYGKPWFIAAHVCAVLGLSNARMAVAVLDGDEKADVSLTYTSSKGVIQRRRTTIISESGLFTLILRSRGATTPGTKAHRFRKWVTAEVLPAVRETGRYETDTGTASHEAGSAAWVLTQLTRIMPWDKVMELILPLHAYGSLAANGQPRTGFRRPAFVAAPHRTAAATDFQEHTVMVKLLARQQELPLTEGGAHE